MADLLAQYEEYLATEKHASQNTLSSYMRDLHQFAVYLDEFHPMPLPQVTQEVISGYVAWMGGKGKSAATITRSIASIKSLYTYLQMTGEVSANPAKGVAAVKVEHKFPEILTGKEVELFLDQPQCVDAKGYRDHAMLELLYATGIRVQRRGCEPERELHPRAEQGQRAYHPALSRRRQGTLALHEGGASAAFG